MTKRHKIRSAIGILFIGITCLFLQLFTFAFGRCSIFPAECQYDPRTQKPYALFIQQPPEIAVAQYIEEQARLQGTFPFNFGYPNTSVTSITPTFVKAGGFFTDWHVVAEVGVDVGYSDQTTQHLKFELMESGASTLSLLKDTVMMTTFGPLRECDQSSSGTWHCR